MHRAEKSAHKGGNVGRPPKHPHSVCIRFAGAAGIYQGFLHRHHSTAAAAGALATGEKRKRGRPPKAPPSAREDSLKNVQEADVGRPRKRNQVLLTVAGGADGANGRGERRGAALLNVKQSTDAAVKGQGAPARDVGAMSQSANTAHSAGAGSPPGGAGSGASASGFKDKCWRCKMQVCIHYMYKIMYIHHIHSAVGGVYTLGSWRCEMQVSRVWCEYYTDIRLRLPQNYSKKKCRAPKGSRVYKPGDGMGHTDPDYQVPSAPRTRRACVSLFFSGSCSQAIHLYLHRNLSL